MLLIRTYLVGVLLVVIAQISFVPDVRAESRVALVIGNGAYRNVSHLVNPSNDAADVAAALKRNGFETIVATDLDKERMDEVTIQFARAARNADVAMFYYSGHALQFGGVNYLAPVDAKLVDEADLRRLVRLDDIVVDLEQAKNLRILVLDACRNNPLAEDLKRSLAGSKRAISIQRGLAKIDTPQGMIVAYATQAGSEADDGDGRNSPYTTAFLRHIEASEEIGTIFRHVTNDVYEATKRRQLPELSLSLIGEFYLKGRVATDARSPGTQRIDVNGRIELSNATDDAAWNFIDKSSESDLQKFIREFPASSHRPQADAALAAIVEQSCPEGAASATCKTMSAKQAKADDKPEVKLEAKPESGPESKSGGAVTVPIGCFEMKGKRFC